MPILNVENLSFKVGKKTILDRINLKVLPGKTVGVVGHNGAGKTTLFQLILGFRFASQGTIEIFSKSYLAPEARCNLGYIPERPYFSTELTLKETLLYYGGIQGLCREKILSTADQLLSRLKLSHAIDQKLKTFSKGMLQKTLLIQALLHDPKLLILDEPMSGLDPDSRNEIRTFFHEWKDQGKSILHASHAIDDIENLSDEVLALEQGKITYSGPIQDWRHK